MDPTTPATGLRRYAPNTACAHDRLCALSIVERAVAVIYGRVVEFITGFLTASYGRFKPRVPARQGVVGPHIVLVPGQPPSGDGGEADQQHSAPDDSTDRDPILIRRSIGRCRGSSSMAAVHRAVQRDVASATTTRPEPPTAVDACPIAVARTTVSTRTIGSTAPVHNRIDRQTEPDYESTLGTLSTPLHRRGRSSASFTPGPAPPRHIAGEASVRRQLVRVWLSLASIRPDSCRDVRRPVDATTRGIARSTRQSRLSPLACAAAIQPLLAAHSPSMNAGSARDPCSRPRSARHPVSSRV